MTEAVAGACIVAHDFAFWPLSLSEQAKISSIYNNGVVDADFAFRDRSRYTREAQFAVNVSPDVSLREPATLNDLDRMPLGTAPLTVCTPTPTEQVSEVARFTAQALDMEETSPVVAFLSIYGASEVAQDVVTDQFYCRTAFATDSSSTVVDVPARVVDLYKYHADFDYCSLYTVDAVENCNSVALNVGGDIYQCGSTNDDQQLSPASLNGQALSQTPLHGEWIVLDTGLRTSVTGYRFAPNGAYSETLLTGSIKRDLMSSTELAEMSSTFGVSEAMLQDFYDKMLRPIGWTLIGSNDFAHWYKIHEVDLSTVADSEAYGMTFELHSDGFHHDSPSEGIRAYFRADVVANYRFYGLVMQKGKSMTENTFDDAQNLSDNERKLYLELHMKLIGFRLEGTEGMIPKGRCVNFRPGSLFFDMHADSGYGVTASISSTSVAFEDADGAARAIMFSTAQPMNPRRCR